MASYFEAFDILLAPATACPAFPLRNPPAQIGGRADRGSCCDDTGAAAGVLVFGAFGRDDLVLRLCHGIENTDR